MCSHADRSHDNNPGSKQNLYRLRHSTAHVLAQAVLEIFDHSIEVKLASGPAIEDGFYYDFLLPRALSPNDLVIIEDKMRELLAHEQVFTYEEVSAEQAFELFAQQPFKTELIAGLVNGSYDEDGEMIAKAQKQPLSVYRHANFVDLCRGPHLPSTAAIDPNAFKLLKLAGAYWKGDENRPMLQRIYGTAWFNKEDLDDYLQRLQEAEKRDHRKLGKELELFFFHPTAPGMPYWLPKGFTILNELISWWREVHGREGYHEISSPLINSKKLWEISGHWDHYRNDMFTMAFDNGEVYGVKPMNCPNAMIVFNHAQHSYRDLPLRLSDCDVLHRHEKSGTLHGLLRVQKFQQDDAHIFVADDEAAITDEFQKIIALVAEFYRVFGLKYYFRLATRPQDSVGDSQSWLRAESILHNILLQQVGDFVIAAGDGAFYGPKIDILVKDAIGRDWQMGTIQLDFQLPQRFNCLYVGKDGRKHHPAVIHRVIYGSLERFLGVLLEHCAGKLPLWLSPIQLRMIPIATRHQHYANLLASKLRTAGIRFDIDDSDTSMGSKMRRYRLERIPYVIIIGDKEIAAQQISLRARDEDETVSLTYADLLQKISAEIAEKKL